MPAKAWFREHADLTLADLGEWAVAEVENSGGIDEAVLMAADALAVQRAVQRIESPASADSIQTFGLPGQASYRSMTSNNWVQGLAAPAAMCWESQAPRMGRGVVRPGRASH